MSPLPTESRFIVAPDKFKGTLSARAAAAAMADGVRAAFALSGTEEKGGAPLLQQLPLADGGEGSLSSWQALFPQLRAGVAKLPDAGGRLRPTAFLASAEERIFECARLLALGFPSNRRLPIEERSSAGLGLWCRAQIAPRPNTGPLQLRVFVGGTAVCDGGFGALRALGHRFVDRSGVEVERLFDLERAVRLIPADRQTAERLTVEVLTDVTNPLCGPTGAALLFAPQKGADPETARRLDRLLLRLLDLLRDSRLPCPSELPPGIGAGGGIALALWGLGAGRVSFASGAARLLEESGIAGGLGPGHVLITGEGCTDAGTLEGKLVHALRGAAEQAGARCIVVSGSIRDRALLEKAGYDSLFAASPDGPPSPKQARARLTEAVRLALLSESA